MSRAWGMRYNNDFREVLRVIEVLNAHVYDCTVLTNTRSNDAVYVVCRHGGGVGGGGAGDWRGEQRAEAGGCVCVWFAPEEGGGVEAIGGGPGN